MRFLFLHLNKLGHSNAWPGTGSKKIEYLVNNSLLLNQRNMKENFLMDVFRWS